MSDPFAQFRDPIAAEPLAIHKHIPVQIEIQVMYKKVVYLCPRSDPAVMARVEDVWNMDLLVAFAKASPPGRLVEADGALIPLCTEQVIVRYYGGNSRTAISLWDKQPLEGPIFNLIGLGAQIETLPVFVGVLVHGTCIPTGWIPATEVPDWEELPRAHTAGP